MVRDFDWGKTRRLASGRVLREWEISATDKEIEVAPGVKFPAWTYNGRVPGPTLRCREGEKLRIRFGNGSSHPHTIHFHGIHPALMDGMPGIGENRGGGLIEPGKTFTYEFEAEPFGMHHYHCHVSPLAAHIAKGLYGAFIVDPKQGRADADELVMVMNGFDTNFDLANEIYAVNTVGFHYARHPIRVKRGELVRIYLLNILEFDQINSFHIHANFFDYYPTGTRAGADRVHRHDHPGAGPARHPGAALPLRGALHVPRPQDRVRRARLARVLRGRLMEGHAESPRLPGLPTWALGLIPLALIAAAVAAFALLGAPGLGDRNGPPVEELAVERTVLHPGEIELTVRNDGPDAVTIAQVTVNDAFVDFSAGSNDIGRLAATKVTIPYDWIEGEGYEIAC